jgi:uroporphyrinogen decarboxylase
MAKTWTDLWQVRHHKVQEGIMPFPASPPLEQPKSWRDYEWPDPNDPALYTRAKAVVAGISDRVQVILAASHRSTLLERAWKLVGMENLFTMLLSEPQKAGALLDRILEFQMGVARHYLDMGVEMASPGDDHGTQRGLLLSPQIFRAFFQPRYRRLIELYKSKDCIVSFHSCGNILELVPDLIDLGIDILNPAQATANDLEALRARTRTKMTLQGAVRSATVFEGPPGRIKLEVKERILALAQEGGYICAPDQGLPFPAEHTKALEEAVEEYGMYPLAKG